MPIATPSPCSSRLENPVAASSAWPNVWPRLSSARSPVSVSSRSTTPALARTLAATALVSAPVSPDSINPATNTRYYVDNFTNFSGPIYGTHNTQMNGYTTVLQVTLPVQRGVKSHIKLAVEDATDDIYDTWVLIKLGSLASHNVTATNPTRFVYSPATGTLTGNFTVINANNFTYQGSVYLIFTSLPPGVTLSETQVASSSGNYQGTRHSGRTIDRPQYPEDLVGAVMFLSSAASNFITGQTLLVDGGKAMH